MLAVRCQFLQGTYQAALPGSTTQPEWPPHPARLHHALTAAAFALGGDEIATADLEALRWLERQPSPQIACPPKVGNRHAPIVYVPRNLSRSEFTDVTASLRAGRDIKRLVGRNDRRFPTIVTGDQPVWFVWADSTPDEATLAGMARLASAVQYLGSSRSPVACAVAGDPPEATHVPHGGIDAAPLRVAYEGLTDALIRDRGSERIPDPGATIPYGKPHPVPAEHRRGPFDTMIVLARSDGYPLPVQHAEFVAERFRAAVLSQAGDHAPEVIHGHGRHPHVAFVALPNVGHRYADGSLMGVAAVIPADTSDDERRAIATAVGGVRRLALSADVRPWALTSPTPESHGATVRPSTWMFPSAVWSTATPILLDRHPKGSRGESIEDAMRQTLANAGLPEPRAIELNRHPFLPGSVPAGLHRRAKDRRAIGLHARIEFGEPVRGPLLAGRGRYLGIGLLRPVRLPAERRNGGSDDQGIDGAGEGHAA